MAYTVRDIKDRVIQYPRRYQLVPVDGQAEVYDLVPITGSITNEGTKINKAYLQPIEDVLNGLGNVTYEIATQAEVIAGIANNKYVTPEGLSALKNNLSGSKSFSHSVPISTAQQQTIAIGENKTRGMLLITTSSGTGIVFFSTEKLDTKVIKIADLTAGFISRRKQATIATAGNSDSNPRHLLGNPFINTQYRWVSILDIYISGTNIVMDLFGNATDAITMNYQMDWEVW